jgi:dGTPase
VLYRESDRERFATYSTALPSDAYRSAFRKDYGRLLHSAAFRRLQGKTQLFPGDDSDFFRNRLTHSLEVAQIAHCVAAKLNTEVGLFKEQGIDLDLVELAALAHDIGHPPFGHNGEKVLNESMCLNGGFEGNAQTLRILTHSCRKVEGQESVDGVTKSFGLDLTKRSIAAVLKYDRVIPAEQTLETTLTKGYYGCEEKLVAAVKRAVVGDDVSVIDRAPRGFKTIECSIMDLSDDIAYSTYDLEDAFKAGFLTPLDLIALDDHIQAELLRRVNSALKKEDYPPRRWSSIRETILKLLEDMPLTFRRANGPSSDVLATARNLEQARRVARDSVERTSVTSQLIGRFVDSVVVEPFEECPALSYAHLPEATRLEVEILKNLTYLLVTESHRLRIVRVRGEEIVRTIFQEIQRSPGLMPDDYWKRYQKTEKFEPELAPRVICDFVSGMTDRYAVEFYARLTSEEHRTIFKPM